MDGSEGQQYEDLDADILRTGGVNAAGAIYSLLRKHTVLDVDLDACATAEMLSMPSQCRCRSELMWLGSRHWNAHDG